MAIETAEEQVVNRWQTESILLRVKWHVRVLPYNLFLDLHQKKVKGSNKNANAPWPLRHTGTFFHIRIGKKNAKNVLETLIEMDNSTVRLQHMNRDIETLDNSPPSGPPQKDHQVGYIDMDIESDGDVGPYKTPVTLQKQKRGCQSLSLQMMKTLRSKLSRRNRR